MPVIDVYLSQRRDTAAARCLFTRAMNTTKVSPVEVTADKAAVYPRVSMSWPPTCHHTEQYATTRCRPATDSSNGACTRCAGADRPRSHSCHHWACIRANIRRGHYEIGIEKVVNLRVLDAFDELTLTI